VAAVVLAYVLVGGLASIPYTVWQKRRRAAELRGRPPVLALADSGSTAQRG
jgi:hypothetical protein